MAPTNHLHGDPSTRRMRRLIAAGSAGLVLAALPASAALADPRPFPGQSTMLSCAGQEYEIVLTPSSGEWTPAFDTTGNRVFQPVGFLENHFEVTVIDGPNAGYTEAGSDDTQVLKGGTRTGQRTVDCMFESTFSGYDEYLEGNVEGSWGGIVRVVLRG